MIQDSSLNSSAGIFIPFYYMHLYAGALFDFQLLASFGWGRYHEATAQGAWVQSNVLVTYLSALSLSTTSDLGSGLTKNM